MNIVEATGSYEKWLGDRLTLIPEHLQHKHQHMAQSVFLFLRATFYRFMQLWPEHAGDAAKGVKVLAVGDLHVENYGTWRDAEGRLIWGCNDFDETYPLPFTVDLVRLAVSAHMAAQDGHMAVEPSDACDAILAGYRDGLTSGGKPFVLAEEHKWLRDTVTGVLRDPVTFWGKMEGIPDCSMDAPKQALRGLDHLLPCGAEVDRIALREAGEGSLGRQRFVMLARLNGARMARETKTLCASACVWAGVRGGTSDVMYEKMLGQAVRALDPYVQVRHDWVVRRLAPYCSRVELTTLPKEHDQLRLLRAMGFETANLHLGTLGAAKRLLSDLKARPKRWLHKAAERMLKATARDFEEWRAAGPY
jgi:hypothetical protein